MRETLQDLAHGDHACLFFTTRHEQAAVTAPFLALGLSRNERCVYVGDEDSLEAVRHGLKNHGVDVEHQRRKGRLVLTSEQDYLDDGKWKTEKMLGFLQAAYDEALTGGFSALRAAGDVSWQIGPDRDFKDAVYYETLLDLFFVGKKMVGLCEYSKQSCPPETLQGILNTHKIASIDADVCQNFHYVPPELLLEKDDALRHSKRVEWMTSQLLRAKKAEQERDALHYQLLRSQKTEAVGRLAAGVAHDFNNVLTAIAGFCHFLKTDPKLEDIEGIEKAQERAAALTRRLLAFGRTQVHVPKILDPNAAIEELSPMLERVLTGEIRLVLELDRSTPPVKVDPGHLEQVLVNLVLNAKDAISGSGTITIATRPEGSDALLSVSDTGSGMSQETLSHLFEPFFTTKAPDRGTGLGLSTAYGIVKQSGGRLEVDSREGSGSTFKIFLPRSEKPKRAPRAARKPVRPFSGSGTILFVEEDDLVRRVLSRALDSLGFDVLSARDSDEALYLYREHHGAVRLLIADLVRVRGDALARRLRSDSPSLKVIFTSGHPEPRLLEPLDPDTAFLQKPIDLPTLASTARTLLEGEA